MLSGQSTTLSQLAKCDCGSDNIFASCVAEVKNIPKISPHPHFYKTENFEFVFFSYDAEELGNNLILIILN